MEPLTPGAEDPFRALVRVVERLRAPGGCPWDREQTHRSLRPYVIEEAYEVAEAIDEGEPGHLGEELGDLLLQVVLHSVIAAESGHFDIDAVVRGITEKIVRRHPHVFAAGQADTPDQVRAGWEEIKRRERAAAGRADPMPSRLDGVTASLPALAEAEKLQARAAQAGFDWTSAREAWPKVEEEMAEFLRAWDGGDRAAIEEELGDLFFALVNVARLLGLSPELALKAANRKFSRRFRALEEEALNSGRLLEEMTLDEMDELWKCVKDRENRIK